eukprot:365623-Chlamydomonas_euryale.AAC.8
MDSGEAVSCPLPPPPAEAPRPACPVRPLDRAKSIRANAVRFEWSRALAAVQAGGAGPREGAARRVQRRRGRGVCGMFLAEGPPHVVTCSERSPGAIEDREATLDRSDVAPPSLNALTAV